MTERCLPDDGLCLYSAVGTQERLPSCFLVDFAQTTIRRQDNNISYWQLDLEIEGLPQKLLRPNMQTKVRQAPSFVTTCTLSIACSSAYYGAYV